MEPESRFIPDIGSNLEWDLVARATYAAVENGDGTYKPIPAKQFLIQGSYVLMIGIKTELAPANWYTGGWASQRLLTSPSSQSEFTADVQTCSFRLKRGQLNLCLFPKHQPTWLLGLRFPHWLKNITVEVWRYDGRDLDVFTTGAIAVVPNIIPQSATAVVLLAADVTRQGAILLNEAEVPLAIEFDAVPSMSANLVVLQPHGYFEVPYAFKGEIQGIWATAGDGFVKIREFH